MANVSTLEDVVYFLVRNAPRPLGITSIMKLVYLADVEHVQRYGERLCDVEWAWHHYGPFAQAVFTAVETLHEENLVEDVLLADCRRFMSDPPEQRVSHETRLSASQCRALVSVLQQYGCKTLRQLKQAAYETRTMREAQPGDRLDVLMERRVDPANEIPGLGLFVAEAPEPDTRAWGDPAESAEEDEAILREFASLRAAANEELREDQQ